MALYKLPELPFDPGALEPFISGRIIELHHGKHHAAYVKNANATLDSLQEARSKNDFARIQALERALAFNLSGHILHSVFWQNLTPKGGGTPTGPLAAAIDQDFGSFDAFKTQMNEAAGTVMGSGWSALVWEPVGRRLLVSQIYDHQSNVAQGAAPLMVMDAWEHAYYLQYANEKAQFFGALWNLWNWPDIQSRFLRVRELDAALPGTA
ncbi:MAG: superoxide dismutase [Deltaproteobacteria bacterium]|nr:superoxide dismutase [Deltaproteobacteria bacterium]